MALAELRQSRAAVVIVSMGALIQNGLLWGPGAINYALRGGGGDFPHFYTGAKLVFGGQLYNPARAVQVQRELGVDRVGLGMTRLPFYYALLWPLGRLSYPAARATWIAVQIAASLAFLALYPAANRAALIIATAFSFPLFTGVIIGQDFALLLLILAAGLWLRSKGRAVAAGVILSLLLIKFHIFLFVPVLFF
jgi:hypothetical protein